mmetsp:Transcript_32267/g.51462  ORF Transcript_32267/g.51462 Transcript_32267/m.51462 type:complete len:83 (-) Transcript_32267:368-616(-)
MWFIVIFGENGSSSFPPAASRFTSSRPQTHHRSMLDTSKRPECIRWGRRKTLLKNLMMQHIIKDVATIGRVVNRIGYYCIKA